MHLAISACLLLAAKYDEVHPAPIDDFLYLYRKLDNRDFRKERIDAQKFKAIEMHITESIAWNFTMSPPYSMLRFFAMSLNYGNYCHQFSKAMLDIIILNSETCHFTPSISATIAIIISQKFLSSKSFRQNCDYEIDYREKVPFKQHMLADKDSPNWFTENLETTECKNSQCNHNCYQHEVTNGVGNFYHQKYLEKFKLIDNLEQTKIHWLDLLYRLSGYPLEHLQSGIVDVAKFLKTVFTKTSSKNVKHKILSDKYSFFKEFREEFYGKRVFGSLATNTFGRMLLHVFLGDLPKTFPFQIETCEIIDQQGCHFNYKPSLKSQTSYNLLDSRIPIKKTTNPLRYCFSPKLVQRT